MDAQIPGPGELIAGKLRVEKVLGAGGMGVVLAARHQDLGERVAVKMLRLPTGMDKRAVERLRREARAAAKLRGEHVVRVMDVGALENGAPYIVMEYVAGRTVAQAREASGRIPIATAVDWVLQACEALAEAHGQNIVHRDIKPSNLLLTMRPDGSPLIKLLDFGIAKSLAIAPTTLTETGGFLGSPLYASPEQARDARVVDHRTDIWSLGVVLYELVTGKLPFPSYTATAALASVVADPPIDPRTVVAEIPLLLEDALLRCLEKEPQRRFDNVADLARALEPHGSEAARGATERVERILNQVGKMTSDPTPELDSESTLSGDQDADSQSPASPETAPRGARRWTRWWPLAAILALTAGLTAARGRAPSKPAERPTAPIPLTSAPVVTVTPAAAPAAVVAPLTASPAASPAEAPTSSPKLALPNKAPSPRPATVSPRPAKSPAANAPDAVDEDFGPRK